VDADEIDNDIDGNTAVENVEIGKGTWQCRIVVNGESICVASGWNRLEVETAASDQAVGILRARKAAAIAFQDGILREDEVMLDAGSEHDETLDDDDDADESQNEIADIDARAGNATHGVQQEDDVADNSKGVSLEQAELESPRKRKRASVDEVTSEIGRSRVGCLAS